MFNDATPRQREQLTAPTIPSTPNTQHLIHHSITYRPATEADIPGMHRVRVSVRENRLSHPDRIGTEDYRLYLTVRGRGWVATVNEDLVGFAIVDMQESTVWALFVRPDSEGTGMGRQLHDTMLRWYFSQTAEVLRLTTCPGTRAVHFYQRAGWTETGPKGDETGFEIERSAFERYASTPHDRTAG